MIKTLLCCFLFLSLTCSSQHQDRTLFVYNVGLGAFSSGIGAVINKPKHSDWKKSFIKGFWQGSIGGALNYSSKRTLYLINKNNEPLYAWPAKILHAAGLSIMENASLNEPFLQNWNIDYGPVRFDFSVNGKRKFRARFLWETVVSVIYASKTADFNLGKTLSTGNLVFVNANDPYVSWNNRLDLGYSFGRAIAIGADGIGSNQVLAHEIVHQFQFGDFQVFNTWLKPLERKIKSKTIHKIFSNYIYFNIPYFWGLYELEGRFDHPHYFRNFYEFEAQRFSTNKFVQR